MNRISLPLDEIVIENRQRQDLGDIDRLADSLRERGLIQPVVVNQDKRLLAGGRRLAAARKLGWTSIDVVYKETLSDDEKYLIELEENVARKDYTWQERCLNIAEIHVIKRRLATLDSKQWGQRETAEALGLDSHCVVSYALKVAQRLLLSKEDPIWQCDTMFEAYRLIMREEVDKGNAILAARQSNLVFDAIEATPVEAFDEPPLAAEVSNDANLIALRERARGTGYLSLNEQEQRTLYESNPLNPPADFATYRQQRIAALTEEKVIDLSSMLINGDSITYMNANPGVFDHVITDIPYGIDMEMLNQQNPHGGMVDIDTVEKEHDVDANKSLFAAFFPAAYACTKDNAFVITWCDIMNWQLMYNLAIAAGFKVQRWPITWCKTHQCMNQSASVNFTKTTEIAIVCRKGTPTLIKPMPRCDFNAGRDDLCQLIDHPFAKPYEAWRFLADAVSFEGQLILEPFAGRGSGVLSMLWMKRRVVGVELNTNHYNSLLENVKQHHFLKLNANLKFK